MGLVWFSVGSLPEIFQKHANQQTGKFKNIFLDGVRITFIWFTVQEGQVIDGDVPSKIIPNCTFNQNLPNRKKSTFTVTDKDF